MNVLGKLGFAICASFCVISAPALADGDAAKGERVFRKCTACHSLEEGKKKVGPSLFNIMGKAVGAEENFRYSKIVQAAAETDLTWTEEVLMEYLADPQKYLEAYLTEQNVELPGGRTKMSYRLKKEDQRADLIAYLKSVSN